MEEISTSFKALKTKEARSAALRAVLEQLDLNEWRQLKAVADSKTLQRDIIGTLPLEIVAHVVQFLDLSEIILLQTVSKHWNAIFSSPFIYHVTLRKHGIDLPRQDISRAEWQRYFTRHAKQRIRLERGIPTSNVVYALRPNLSPTFCFDYSHGRFVWVEGGRTLAVLNLRSGVLQRYSTENRDFILGVRISGTIVTAVLARGYCYSWNHHTEECRCFRLPSLRYDLFVVDGVTVAFCFTDVIVVWDFESGMTRTIEMESKMVSMSLNHAENRLTTVRFREDDEEEVDLDSSAQALGTQVRLVVVETYSLGGSSQSLYPESPRRRELPVDAHLIGRPRQYGNHLAMLGLTKTESSPHHFKHFLIPYTLEGEEVNLHVLGTDYIWLSVGCMAFVSRNLLYCVTKNLANYPELRIYNSHAAQRSFRTPKCMEITERPPGQDYDFEDDSLHRLVGDDDFVIFAREETVQVWCFDEEIRLPHVPGLSVVSNDENAAEEGIEG